MQKRIGCRLRRLKRDIKGVKLKDGKVLTGKGRLTDEEIDPVSYTHLDVYKRQPQLRFSDLFI